MGKWKNQIKAFYKKFISMKLNQLHVQVQEIVIKYKKAKAGERFKLH